jgi:hypothetical protein
MRERPEHMPPAGSRTLSARSLCDAQHRHGSTRSSLGDRGSSTDSLSEARAGRVAAGHSARRCHSEG